MTVVEPTTPPGPLTADPRPWSPIRGHSEEWYPFPIENADGLVVAVAESHELATLLARAPHMDALIKKLDDLQKEFQKSADDPRGVVYNDVAWTWRKAAIRLHEVLEGKA